LAKINPNIKIKRSESWLTDPNLFTEKILAGDRVALGKAITLLESESISDENHARELLIRLMAKKRTSFRIGISGAPGAGKSTLIEALGLYLVDQGYKPAVLAIDPSSTLTGGSILGDKTRMTLLSQKKEAFIRPSPAGRTLGGVARKTRESILLLEAAAYDPIIIETVGVGQSETTVKSMTDLFLLLIAPGAGDEIQGIKRGIMELADLIAINKMDGKLKDQARETMQYYGQAIELIKKENAWQSKILGISAIQGEGIKELWTEMQNYRVNLLETGRFFEKREAQNISWFEDHIRNTFLEQLLQQSTLKESYAKLKELVRKNEMSPFMAADEFLQKIKEKNDDK
jgi:LAO/AO transport system kinase